MIREYFCRRKPSKVQYNLTCFSSKKSQNVIDRSNIHRIFLWNFILMKTCLHRVYIKHILLSNKIDMPSYIAENCRNLPRGPETVKLCVAKQFYKLRCYTDQQTILFCLLWKGKNLFYSSHLSSLSVHPWTKFWTQRVYQNYSQILSSCRKREDIHLKQK